LFGGLLFGRRLDRRLKSLAERGCERCWRLAMPREDRFDGETRKFETLAAADLIIARPSDQPLHRPSATDSTACCRTIVSLLT
jgi:hypothetical protein